MMDNQNTMQFAKEVVTEEIRKGNLVKSKEVFAMLPGLMDTVRDPALLGTVRCPVLLVQALPLLKKRQN